MGCCLVGWMGESESLMIVWRGMNHGGECVPKVISPQNSLALVQSFPPRIDQVPGYTQDASSGRAQNAAATLRRPILKTPGCTPDTERRRWWPVLRVPGGTPKDETALKPLRISQRRTASVRSTNSSLVPSMQSNRTNME